MNVLVADDCEPLLRALRRELEMLGHHVTTAASCADARQHQGPFDLAVLDLDLGDGNGSDLARDLLVDDVVASVVFYTGTLDERLIRQAQEVGPVVMKEGMVKLLAFVDQVTGEGTYPPRRR